MTSVLEPIQLNWKDTVYEIPANKVMGAIRLIEDVVTLDQLAEYAEKGTAPLAKISSAYGRVLRYAGCIITDDEIYAEMFDEAKNVAAIMTAVQGIMVMMLPPKKRRALEELKNSGELDKIIQEAEGDVGKPEGRSLPGLPTKPLRPQSAGAGSNRKNFGNSTRKNSGSSWKRKSHKK